VPRSGEHRWRGKIPIPKHAHPLVRQFVERCNDEQTLIGEVAVRAGLAPDTVSDWRYRRSPLLDNFVAALNALDLELVIRPRREQR
jgi:hypothetical protein